jgi:hypothetical protein
MNTSTGVIIKCFEDAIKKETNPAGKAFLRAIIRDIKKRDKAKAKPAKRISITDQLRGEITELKAKLAAEREAYQALANHHNDHCNCNDIF